MHKRSKPKLKRKSFSKFSRNYSSKKMWKYTIRTMSYWPRGQLRSRRITERSLLILMPNTKRKMSGIKRISYNHKSRNTYLNSTKKRYTMSNICRSNSTKRGKRLSWPKPRKRGCLRRCRSKWRRGKWGWCRCRGRKKWRRKSMPSWPLMEKVKWKLRRIRLNKRNSHIKRHLINKYRSKKQWNKWAWWARKRWL